MIWFRIRFKTDWRGNPIPEEDKHKYFRKENQTPNVITVYVNFKAAENALNSIYGGERAEIVAYEVSEPTVVKSGSKKNIRSDRK